MKSSFLVDVILFHGLRLFQTSLFIATGAVSALHRPWTSSGQHNVASLAFRSCSHCMCI